MTEGREINKHQWYDFKICADSHIMCLCVRVTEWYWLINLRQPRSTFSLHWQVEIWFQADSSAGEGSRGHSACVCVSVYVCVCHHKQQPHGRSQNTRTDPLTLLKEQNNCLPCVYETFCSNMRNMSWVTDMNKDEQHVSTSCWRANVKPSGIT